MRSTTRWTLIGAARDGDAEAERDFCHRYRAPVLSFVRRQGIGAEAEDLTQEVFLKLFRGGVLDRADAEKGRFRDLLLAVTKHVVADHHRAKKALKRGGGAEVLPLEAVEVPAPEARDSEFDREWLLNVVENALERLERDHPNYHAAVSLTLLGGHSRAEVAQRLGRPEHSIRNWVHRGKGRLRSYLREEAWNYTASNADYELELAYLAKLLTQGAGSS